jgi:hypothetical protein
MAGSQQKFRECFAFLKVLWSSQEQQLSLVAILEAAFSGRV